MFDKLAPCTTRALATNKRYLDVHVLVTGAVWQWVIEFIVHNGPRVNVNVHLGSVGHLCEALVIVNLAWNDFIVANRLLQQGGIVHWADSVAILLLTIDKHAPSDTNQQVELIHSQVAFA